MTDFLSSTQTHTDRRTNRGYLNFDERQINHRQDNVTDYHLTKRKIKLLMI